MKKNIVGVVLAFILFWPSIIKAASSCSYSEQVELNSIAGNVKASYDVIEIKTGKAVNPDAPGMPEIDIYKKGLKIKIINVSNDIYLKIINKNTNEEKTYQASDLQDGTIVFEYNDVNTITTYAIEIYANKYSCNGELIRTFDFVTPQYNFYSELEICNQYPDFYYCQEFVTVGENISYDAFLNKVEELKEEKKQEEIEKEEIKNKSFLKKLKDLYYNNKIVINLIGCVIVVGGLTTTVIIIKKKRSRVL